MLSLPPGKQGVLPSQLLREAISDRVIHGGEYDVPISNVQPASLDLTLDDIAYRIRCSFLAGRDTVERRVKDYIIDVVRLDREGVVLETNRPYLIPLRERLALPPGLSGKANPKSSIGRLDVFTRVITDHSYRFDEIESGYEGRLYLEVVPLSFPIRVKEGLSLNQLRLVVGRPEMPDDEVREFHQAEPLLYRDGRAVPVDQLALSNGLLLGLDLRGGRSGYVGYRSREHAPLVDLTKGERADPGLFWQPVQREQHDRIVLTESKFYLLMSNEAVSIPPMLASEMTAYDPTGGELRTHYAGFFDPGFGYDATGSFRGSRAALEVRAHEVPFMIEHGQHVCKLTFERMLQRPDSLYGESIGSSYQEQSDTLSKYFARLESQQTPPPNSAPTAVDENQLVLPIGLL